MRSSVSALATKSATRESIATTMLEPTSAPGAGATAIGPMCHDCNLGISGRLGCQPERDQELVLVTPAFAKDVGAADAQQEVGLPRTKRAV